MANRILGDQGLPRVEIAIELTPKRRSVTFKSGGVDISAMSGMEQVAYGSAVLFSLAQASNAKYPCFWCECAELDEECFDAFVRAMSKAFDTEGVRGCVFLARWGNVSSDRENVRCIPVGEKLGCNLTSPQGEGRTLCPPQAGW